MNRLIVSPSPHIKGNRTTASLMRDVLIALMPAFIVSVVVSGINALTVTLISVVSCALFEYLIQRFLIKGPFTLGNCSAAVTGVLLAFNLPASLPPWMVIIGALAAIGIGKMSFGGLGRNPFNPAIVGRIFLHFSFPIAMITFPEIGGVDAFSGATPLTFVKEAVRAGVPLSEITRNLHYSDLLLGIKSGSLGEVSAIALILGFIYLLWRKVITWHIPACILGTMFLFSLAMNLIDPERFMGPLFNILTGGALLGAIYMATDYSTSPMIKRGMIIYAAGIGLLTMVIRLWGAYPEGMSFAILIMNAFVPLINKYVKPRRFGIYGK